MTQTGDHVVWLASYPRSGNTWFRALWHHYTRLPTYAAHAENHRSKVPIPIGADYHDPARAAVSALTKTHWRRHDDRRRSIAIVRDGRDVAVSYFHYLKQIDGQTIPDDLLQARIAHGDIMFGSWENWLQNWLVKRKMPVDIVWTYDELVNGLNKTIVLKTLNVINAPKRIIEQCLQTDSEPPTFRSLQRTDPKFFRCGKSGDHENYKQLTNMFIDQQAEGMRMWDALKYERPENRGKMFR